MVGRIVGEEVSSMEREFRTVTYDAGKGDNGWMRLKLDTEESRLFPKNIEIKAKVDLETGAVKLFVDPQLLQKYRD